MLTGYQVEVVAYILRDGAEYLCPEHAMEGLTEIERAKLENGTADYIGTPIIRYTLDELNGERQYEAARERLDDFRFDHPQLAAALLTENNEWRMLDRIAERIGDLYDEPCGQCGCTLGTTCPA